jgi:hypothetical protein
VAGALARGYPAIPVAGWASRPQATASPTAPLPIARPQRKTSCIPACLITLLLITVVGGLIVALILIALLQDDAFRERLDQALSRRATTDAGRWAEQFDSRPDRERQ